MGAVADDLKAAHGRAFVHVGPDQPAETHALVHAMNEALGARGTTLDLIDPVEHAPVDQAASLAALVEDMRAGRVTALLMIDTNPVYRRAGHARLRRGAEARAVQPRVVARAGRDRARGQLVRADGACVGELGATRAPSTARRRSCSRKPCRCTAARARPSSCRCSPIATGTPSREAVEATWKPRFGDSFGDAWHDALASGVVANSASGKTDVALRSDVARLAPPTPPDQPLTILFRPDPHVWDGRFADNPWLLELPRPLTKLTWDNPLLIAPALAGRLGVVNGDRVRLSVGRAEMTAPVWLLPGQAPDCVIAPLGFGRSEAGLVGQGAGFDFYRMTGWTGAPDLRKVGGDRSPGEHRASRADLRRRGRIRPPRLARSVPEGPEHSCTPITPSRISTAPIRPAPPPGR